MNVLTTTGHICPKCQSVMRTYERSGVHIDQCTGCRGAFLDRGELDQLIDIEARRDHTDAYVESYDHPYDDRRRYRRRPKRRRNEYRALLD
jgi:Zn-finger nucleic acid-binding protein